MFHFLAFATLLAATAAWFDWRTGHIPNRLTLVGLAVAILGHFLHGTMTAGLGAGVEQAAFAAFGALGCALVPLFMHWKGAMGGGDVKLFAALGAALHPLAGLEAETYAFVAAMLLAPAKLAWEGTLLRTLASTVTLVVNPLRKKAQRKPMPKEMVTWFRLGPAVFLGTAATLVIHLFSVRSIP
ncbi:MAG TPA: A24 family peptidase [Labilithrix sp.]|nr:A24 family peptidase [Labilithrix sp.]